MAQSRDDAVKDGVRLALRLRWNCAVRAIQDSIGPCPSAVRGLALTRIRGAIPIKDQDVFSVILCPDLIDVEKRQR